MESERRSSSTTWLEWCAALSHQRCFTDFCYLHGVDVSQPNDHSPPVPYGHPVFEALIIRVAFLGNGIGRLYGLVEACSRKLGDDESFNPIPIPLLALAATAVGIHMDYTGTHLILTGCRYIARCRSGRPDSTIHWISQTANINLSIKNSLITSKR